MAYGSTLTDLQMGVNNEAAIQASRDASQRDYYARLAEMRRLRDAQNQNNAYQNRALDTNARLQGRQIDNTGAYQTGTLALGGREVNAKVAQAVAEAAQAKAELDATVGIADKDRAAAAENIKLTLANNLAMAEKRVPDWHTQDMAFGQAAAENDQNTALATTLNNAIEPLYKAYETKLNDFEVMNWKSWGKNTPDYNQGLEDKLNESINSIISGANVDPNRVEFKTYTDANGKLRKRFAPRQVSPNLGTRSPVPSGATGTAQSGNYDSETGRPRFGTPNRNNRVVSPVPGTDIMPGGVQGVPAGATPTPTPATPATQILSVPTVVAPRAVGIPGMGGSFGGGPSQLAPSTPAPAPAPNLELLRARRAQFEVALIDWNRKNPNASVADRNAAKVRLLKEINSQTK